MEWPLQPVWQDEDVFVLGGGPSVGAFPMSRLEGRKVVGCNDAYRFGESVVDVLVFGDIKWYRYHQTIPEFQAFKNPIITNHKKLKDEDGIIWGPREEHGFHRHAIGWNGNTGSAAINVALLLGAGRIFLLGFEMAKGHAGKSNWHPNPLDNPGETHYTRYKDEMSKTVHMIVDKWPGVKVINLNPNSTMDVFPKMSWEEAGLP
jgi:hypothetical protein